MVLAETMERSTEKELGSPIVEAVGVTKSFGNLKVLDGIDLSLGRGEVVVLIGPSGSGKSTFLRCLNRLVDPDAGRIVINGTLITDKRVDLPRVRRQIGFVSQSFNLYPHKSAIRNVMEGPLTVLKLTRGEARERSIELLGRVGLSDKINALPRQLSGGQQQRVAIARALAMQPSVMLFDEPTSALDPELTGEVLDVMKRLADDGMTMLIATHEMHFARRVADRIVMIDGGVVSEQGDTETFFRSPSKERTRRFLSQLLSWETE